MCTRRLMDWDRGTKLGIGQNTLNLRHRCVLGRLVFRGGLQAFFLQDLLTSFGNFVEWSFATFRRLNTAFSAHLCLEVCWNVLYLFQEHLVLLKTMGFLFSASLIHGCNWPLYSVVLWTSRWLKRRWEASIDRRQHRLATESKQLIFFYLWLGVFIDRYCLEWGLAIFEGVTSLDYLFLKLLVPIGDRRARQHVCPCFVREGSKQFRHRVLKHIKLCSVVLIIHADSCL